ncbi:MAG: hypothetical protein EOO73_20020 [Myxococcales bacterium]|nr:MAG: hypothetical protein EOO73_20020 [Myxococcales bacterium]
MRALGGGCALWLLTSLGCGPRSAPTELRVAEQNARRVVEPSRFGWASSERRSDELPSAIALGGAGSGRVLLFFEFPELSEPRRLLRAELLLATTGTPGDSVPVELSRAAELAGELHRWSEQPQSAYPRVSARLVSEGAPARLDVTELARARSKPEEPLRVLLLAEPGDGAPVLVRTGAEGGLGPRLESYWE